MPIRHQTMKTSFKNTGKSLLIISLNLAGLLINEKTFAQTDFQNLDFEMAPIDLGPSGEGPFDDYSIPYWIAFSPGQNGEVWLNNYVLDDSIVSLDTLRPLDGTTSVILSGDIQNGPTAPEYSSISQTGFVPQTALSLQFKVGDFQEVPQTKNPPLPGPFFVTMNGQNVPLQFISNNGSYSVIGCNIASWAGKTAALSIGIDLSNQNQYAGFLSDIDDVTFSDTAVVPESNMTTLMWIAAGALISIGAIRTERRGYTLDSRRAATTLRHASQLT